MAKKGEKILTINRVNELGLDKVSVITPDMLKGYTSIGSWVFYNCNILTSVTIPNSVTSIGESAFYCCRGLTSVTIPDSVTSIGRYAFEGCTGLTSIEVASDNSNYCSEDGVLFNKQKTILIQYPEGKQGAYTIPNSVTSIGNDAFIGCGSLASVTIPNSVTNIGKYAFSGCTGLTSVTIPNSVTSIGEGAFRGCIGLTSVAIGDKTYKNQVIKDGKCKAYKAFNADMICRNFQYEEGKTYEFDGKPILCNQGFHACLNLMGVFNYYYGKLGKDIVVHEVELECVNDERRSDSKVVAKKITIGKRIL